MNKIHLFLKQNPSTYLFAANSRILNLSTTSSNHSSNSSSRSSDNDEENNANKSDDKKKSEEALKKLSNLLKTMIEEDVVNSKSKLELAKPKNRRLKHLQEAGTESVKVETTEKQMVKAVKDVAEAIGGNSKQTESELLMRLLNPTAAAAEGDKETSPATSLTDIVKGMKIDRETKSENHSRAEQVRQLLQNVSKASSGSTSGVVKRRPRAAAQNRQAAPVTEKIDLFGSKPLGIFTEDQSNASEGIVNKTWNELYKRELKLAVTHPPSNYFQQMILWTEQGKVWKFPIDNEQGMEEEKNIYFAEHVFLEKHLEPWCPPKGPIRHFMELVCVGLSKNSYLTVEAKKEHIEWYKNYFEDKKQLLQEIGALGETKKDESVKSIEE